MAKFEWLHLAKEISRLRIKLEPITGTHAFIAWGANPYVAVAEIRTYHRKGNITNIVAFVYKHDAANPYDRLEQVARNEFKNKKEAMKWCEVTASLVHE